MRNQAEMAVYAIEHIIELAMPEIIPDGDLYYSINELSADLNDAGALISWRLSADMRQ